MGCMRCLKTHVRLDTELRLWPVPREMQLPLASAGGRPPHPGCGLLCHRLLRIIQGWYELFMTRWRAGLATLVPMAALALADAVSSSNSPTAHPPHSCLDSLNPIPRPTRSRSPAAAPALPVAKRRKVIPALRVLAPADSSHPSCCPAPLQLPHGQERHLRQAFTAADLGTQLSPL